MDYYSTLFLIVEVIPLIAFIVRIEHRMTKFETLLSTMCDSCGRIEPGDDRLLKLAPFVPGQTAERRKCRSV